MADVKTLKTRIALKYDSYSAWTTAPGKDLVLLKGEIGICYIGDTNPESNVVPTVLFKVGDGTKTFENLPWASAKAADVYSWAKSETVEFAEKTVGGVKKQYLVFKTGNVENHSVDLSSFATDAEVEAIRSGLDSRITALEGKFTGTDSVQGQIDALDDRMTDAEGDITDLGNTKLDASEFTAFNNGTSKTVAAIEADIEAKANAARDAAKTYADGIVGTEKSEREAADAALSGRIDTAENKLDTLTGADTVNGSVAKALKDAKAYADTKKSEVVGASGDASTANTVYGAKKYAEEKAAAAEQAASEALTAAVNTLNEKDADLAAEDIRLAGLISAEETRAKGIEAGLRTDVDEMKAFFATAEGETLDTALDTLVEIQEYLNGDGSATGGIIDRVATAEEAIENLTGRVDTAEDDIGDLESRATAVEGRATTLEGDVTALETKTAGFTGTIKARVDEVAGAASAAQSAADAAQGDVDALETVVGTLRTEYNVTKALATTNEAAIAANAGDIAENTTAIGNEKTRAEAQEAAIRNEFAAADLTITNKIGNVGTGTVAEAIAAAQSAAESHADDAVDALKTGDVANNAAAIAAVSGRVQTIENDYLKAADFFIIDCGNATLRDGEPTAQ